MTSVVARAPDRREDEHERARRRMKATPAGIREPARGDVTVMRWSNGSRPAAARGWGRRRRTATDTDSPSWIRLIASANSRDTERTCSSGQPSGAGTVSVVTTSLIIGWSRSRSTALPANSPCVQATRPRCSRGRLSRSSSSTIEPPVAISSSRMMARLPATSPTIESMTTRSSASRCLQPAATGRPEQPGELGGRLGVAEVGGDDDGVREVGAAEVVGQHPDRGEVVDRHREEPVHLRRVQGHRQHPVGARRSTSMSATSRPPSEMREASFLSERA